MAVEFGVLGSIETRASGRAVNLGHTRQRLLLAALLMDVNHEVSLDELANRIWGDQQAKRGTLYGYLSRLRRTLAGVKGVEIARRPAGYVLATDPKTVDLYRFRDLVVQARAADGERAAELFGQALDLWRGEALAEGDTAWTRMVRESLHRERLAVELDRSEVRLRLGQHTELLAELRGLAREYPLDEQLAEQVMRARRQSGRTAEALSCYKDVHRVLAREEGIEPGPELRQLRRQLSGSAPAPGPADEPATDSGRPSRPPVMVVPRQLPAPPALFTGRTRELDRLSTALEEAQGEAGGTVVISAIRGTGGIGKTYLALHWAHHHVEQFPDGQLYANLRGFDPSGEPMIASTAVRGFLEALGVEQAALPADPDAQTGLYRSLVADKRMLVVLDNARDTAQVLPLIPGSPTCTVLITSRNQLTGLTTTHAAKPLPLDTLPEDEARALLVRHLGEDRLAAEPEAAGTLLKHCAGLPLALSIIAARAAAQPCLPLTHLTEDLAGAQTRLDTLDTGDITTNLRAVFAASHQALTAETARVFALLGLAPGPDISLHAAASLTATTAPRARTLLRTLEDAHLVQQHTFGRYRMHDLVHLYAAEHGHALDEQEREAALRRLIDHYLHTAHHASQALDRQPMVPVDFAPPAPGCALQPIGDRKAALTWYDTERPCLLAAQRLAADLSWHTPAWQLPWALLYFHWHRDHFREAITLWQVGLDSAEQLPDPLPKAVAHSHLGYAYANALQVPQASEHLEQALPIFEQAGHLPGQAFTHLSFFALEAWNYAGRDLQRGVLHAERARELFRSLGNSLGEAIALTGLGWCHSLLDDHRQARSCCERAVALARSLRSPNMEGLALMRLGFAAHRGGRYTEALTHYHQAITLQRGLGSAYWEAMTLTYLGDTLRALGQTGEARDAWQHALEFYRTQYRTTEAQEVRQLLGALDNEPSGGQ